jgi:hypothetical protein
MHMQHQLGVRARHGSQCILIFHGGEVRVEVPAKGEARLRPLVECVRVYNTLFQRRCVSRESGYRPRTDE